MIIDNYNDLNRKLNKIKHKNEKEQIYFLENLDFKSFCYLPIFNFYTKCSDNCKKIIENKIKQILLQNNVNSTFKLCIKNIYKTNFSFDLLLKSMINEDYLLLVKDIKKRTCLKKHNFIKLIISNILEINNDNDLLLYWYKNNKLDFYSNDIIKFFNKDFIKKNKKSSYLIIKDLMSFIENFNYYYDSLNNDINSMNRFCNVINNIYDSITFDVFLEIDKYFKLYKNHVYIFYTIFYHYIDYIKKDEKLYNKYFEQLEKLMLKKGKEFLFSNNYLFLNEESQQKIKSILLLRKLKGDS